MFETRFETKLDIVRILITAKLGLCPLLELNVGDRTIFNEAVQDIACGRTEKGSFAGFFTKSQAYCAKGH